MRTLKTSPAWSAKSTLSGTTIAARPPGFRIVRTCWTKLSCLLLVSTDEVVAVGRLVRALGAERRVGQDDVVALAARDFVDRVAERDVRLDLVEVQVHQRQPARPRRRAPGRSRSSSGSAWRCRGRARRRVCVLEPLVGGDEEAAGAAGRVADREVLADARVGLHAADHALDERPRREVLAGALLALAGGLLKQPLEGRGLDVDVERGPLGLVDEADELVQVDRVGEAALGAAEDVAEDARLLAERAQRLDVGVEQLGAALLAQVRPVVSSAAARCPRSSAILRNSR